MRIFLAICYCLSGRFAKARILLSRMDTYRITAELRGRTIVEVVIAPSMEAAEAMFWATVLDERDQITVLRITAFRAYGTVHLVPWSQPRDRGALVARELTAFGDLGRAAVRHGHRDWRIIRSGSVHAEDFSPFDLCDAALPAAEAAMPLVPTGLLWTGSYAPTASRSLRTHRLAALQLRGIRQVQDSCRPALAT